MPETWMPVPGHELLEASSWGRVRSRPYTTPMPNGGTKTNEMRATHGVPGDQDRRQIMFRRKVYRVHKLVCAAFHGPRPFPGAVVMHLDEDNQNNTPENLNHPKVKAYHRRVCQAKMRRQATN